MHDFENGRPMRACPLATVAASGLIAAAFAAPALAADAADDVSVLPELIVTGERPASPNMVESTPDPANLPPARDTGEFLRSIPGVSAGRFGGHGLEPVVRGQSPEPVERRQ